MGYQSNSIVEFRSLIHLKRLKYNFHNLKDRRIKWELFSCWRILSCSISIAFYNSYNIKMCTEVLSLQTLFVLWIGFVLIIVCEFGHHVWHVENLLEKRMNRQPDTRTHNHIYTLSEQPSSKNISSPIMLHPFLIYLADTLLTSNTGAYKS